MLSIYPFGSGSLYSASFAVTASHAISASLISYVVTASSAGAVLNPQSGSSGKGVCLITYEQYLLLVSDSTKYFEICDFSKTS